MNKNYIRKKRLNIKQLFVSDDVTTEVQNRYDNVEQSIEALLKYQNKRVEPKVEISKSCRECDFYNYCCEMIPEYSIWDLFKANIADNICKEISSYDISALNSPVSIGQCYHFSPNRIFRLNNNILVAF